MDRFLGICVFLTFTLALGLAQAQEQRRAFVTSTTGTGNLSSWADAGGQTGLAAGDAICQARAAAGGLANPQNFVAWLSDGNNDAYCRVHGLSGKKADNCGQAELPAAAGPWVRTDGYPFADAIEFMLAPDYRVISPLTYNEFGNRVTTSPPRYFTATDETGALRSQGPIENCGGWTLAETITTHGETAATGARWTLAQGLSCGGSGGRLACLERFPGADLPAQSADGRLAFVTSASGQGDLAGWPAAGSEDTGIAAGDAICRTLATNAGLADPDSFKAWLSDASTNAIDRFTNDGPWVRIDGAMLAENKAELTADRRRVPLNVTETGTYLGTGEVWTSTGLDGSLLDAVGACEDWSSADGAESGRTGQSVVASLSWTSQLTRTCNLPSPRLYCLSDLQFIPPVDEIFIDRFEPPPLALTGALNDTGVQWCRDETSTLLDCPVASHPGQDGDYGRDAAALAGTLQKIGIGAAGFDFTKISQTGAALGPDAAEWACVRDNHTGLLWEMKVEDPTHLQSRNRVVTWFNPDSSTNGGAPGSEGFGDCTLPCNTHTYVQAINAIGLCGSASWRMPSRAELMNISFTGGSSTLNTEFFPFYNPFVPSATYWSATPTAVDANRAARVSFRNGIVGTREKNGLERVRLVSGESGVAQGATVCSGTNENPNVVASTPTSEFIVHDDGTVTHERTGLMWMRCALGQTWTGTGCTGGMSFSWQDALVTAESHVFAGHSDWRLPNQNELASIIEDRCWGPAVNAEVFPNTNNSWHRTSSPRSLAVSFSDGSVIEVGTGFVPGSGRVRLVRDAQ